MVRSVLPAAAPVNATDQDKCGLGGAGERGEGQDPTTAVHGALLTEDDVIIEDDDDCDGERERGGGIEKIIYLCQMLL